MYDEADDNKALFLDHVPARYFSEIVLQLSKRRRPAAAWKQMETRDESSVKKSPKYFGNSFIIFHLYMVTVNS